MSGQLYGLSAICCSSHLKVALVSTDRFSMFVPLHYPAERLQMSNACISLTLLLQVYK